MSTVLEVPYDEARNLFLSVLDNEWPALKLDLLDQVWPFYEKFCSQLREKTVADDVREEIIIPAVRRAAEILKSHGRDPPEAGVFTAPRAIGNWTKLRACSNCAQLKSSFSLWACKAGKGIRDPWLLDAALDGLQGVRVHLRAVGESGAPKEECFDWLPQAYHPSFQPELTDTYWTGGEWDDFERSLLNDFKRSLTKYRKYISTRESTIRALFPSGSNNGDQLTSYARWTVARLSGLSWNQIVRRYDLSRYSEPETQAKKRVREFSVRIGLETGRPKTHDTTAEVLYAHIKRYFTLAKSLATKDKEPSIKRLTKA